MSNNALEDEQPIVENNNEIDVTNKKIYDNKQYLNDILNNIKNVLLNMPDEKAIKYVKWMHEKLIENNKNDKYVQIGKEIKDLQIKKQIYNIGKLKKKRKQYLPENYPTSLQVGDVIYVKFGYPYCDELGSGHYGVVLSGIIGSMYLIAPLTSQETKGIQIYFDDLNLPNKDKVTKRSYVVLNQIRFIHYRRIKNILGITDGRRKLESKQVKNIFEAFNNTIKESVD